MRERIARCRCGAVEARCREEPVRVSVCHCLACQQRSGSAFAVQARFAKEHVAIMGSTKAFDRTSDDGRRSRFFFCPTCACTIAYTTETAPDLVAIPVGAFTDPLFPPPTASAWEERKHAWVEVTGEGVEHVH